MIDFNSIFQAIKQFLSDPLNNLLVATILGLIPTAIDKLQRKTKHIYWDFKNATLQASNLNATGKLKVSYRKSGKRSYKNTTKGLSICRFTFWNSGKETILDSDVSSSEPLYLYFGDESEILEIRSISRSNQSVQIQQISKDTIQLLFEYIENKQGAVFDVVYTGENIRPHLYGVVKSGKVKKRTMSPPEITISATPKMYLLMGWMKPHQQLIFLRWTSTIGVILITWLFLTTPGIFTNTDPNIRCYLLPKMIVALISYAFLVPMTWRMVVVPIELRDFYKGIEG